MTEYPYVKTTGKLKEFLEKIQSMGEPKSVTVSWLPTVGFKSRNHRRFIRVLDFIGFIKSNKPTGRWQSYKVKRDAPRVLAEGIVDGYKELFDLYPNTNDHTSDNLENFFQSKVKAGEQVVEATVSTFKALCSLADFGETNVPEAADAIAEPANGDTGPSVRTEKSALLAEGVAEDALDKGKFKLSPEININVQIHISSDASEDQIKTIFESMASNLLNQ